VRLSAPLAKLAIGKPRRGNHKKKPVLTGFAGAIGKTLHAGQQLHYPYPWTGVPVH
jgi:hypothetical protein